VSIKSFLPKISTTNQERKNSTTNQKRKNFTTNTHKPTRTATRYEVKVRDSTAGTRLCGSWLIISLTLIFTFSSCSTISPVSSRREYPSLFKTVENILPQWQVFANGIDYCYGKISAPTLEFWALKIALYAQEIDIVVKGGASNENQILSTKVSSFVRDNNLLAGINAVPFDIVSSKEGIVIQNVGIVISNGKIIAPTNPNYDALVFYRDGKAAIVNQSAIKSIENIENAVGGFHQILTNGESSQMAHNKEARHPRSAAGISQDGKYLYLVVIDGRRAGSIGATEEETALLLRCLGSWEGLNFDGGGSTALAMRFADGKVKVVNTPIHNGIPGQERAVAGCIGVRLHGE